MSRAKTVPLSPRQLEAVAALFGVLAEPSRLELLQALQRRDMTVSELVKACGMKQANVSKHLGALYDQHLVGRERQGTSIVYNIADPIVFSLCDLVCRKMQRDTREAAAVFHPEI